MDKKRCNNFTSNEIDVIVSLVEEFKDIVECKKTDTVTNNRKELEWKKIEGRFNAVCATARTAKMLRSKWESLKKSPKKVYAEHKQSLYGTGGGPGGSGILVAISLHILAIVGIGVTGTSSQFDSDFDLFNSVNELPDNSSNLAQIQVRTVHEEAIMIPAEIIEEEAPTDKNSLHVSEIISFSSWKTWNPQQLRQCKSEVLNVSEPINAGLSSDLCLEDCNGPEEEETKTVEIQPSKFETPYCSRDIKKERD